MTGVGYRAVARAAVLAAVLLAVVMLAGRAVLPGLGTAGPPAPANVGLPRDLHDYREQLETLELPGDLDDRRWVESDLTGLTIGRVDVETFRRLPRGLRSLQVRGSSSLPNLEGLPSSLERLSLAYSSLPELGELPESLRELSLSDLARFRVRDLPPGLERLSLDNTEVADLRGAPGTLQAVTLSGGGVQSLDGMPARVRFVSLHYTRISSLKPLPPSLHALELAKNHLLDPLADDDLPRFLVELAVQHQDLTKITRLPVGLRRLRVSECDGAANVLRTMLPTLSHLEVEGLPLPHGCWLPADLRSLSLRPALGLDPACLPQSLTELYLDAPDAETLGALDAGVAKLAIVGPGDAGLGALATVPRPLRHLVLDHTRSELDALADAAPSLTVLRYRGSPLAVLPPLPEGLEVLDLGGSAELRSLGPLRRRNRDLRVLLLSRSRIDSLAEVPPSVEELDISQTEVGSLEGLPPGLKRLTLSSGRIDSLRGLPPTVRHLAIVD